MIFEDALAVMSLDFQSSEGRGRSLGVDLGRRPNCTNRKSDNSTFDSLLESSL